MCLAGGYRSSSFTTASKASGGSFKQLLMDWFFLAGAAFLVSLPYLPILLGGIFTG